MKPTNCEALFPEWALIRVKSVKPYFWSVPRSEKNCDTWFPEWDPIRVKTVKPNFRKASRSESKLWSLISSTQNTQKKIKNTSVIVKLLLQRCWSYFNSLSAPKIHPRPSQNRPWPKEKSSKKALKKGWVLVAWGYDIQENKSGRRQWPSGLYKKRPTESTSPTKPTRPTKSTRHTLH